MSSHHRQLGPEVSENSSSSSSRISRFHSNQEWQGGGGLSSAQDDLQRHPLCEHSRMDEQDRHVGADEVSPKSLASQLTRLVPLPSQIGTSAALTVNTFLRMESMDQRWEDLEDRILIFLEGRLEFLDWFRKLYDEGVRNSVLLESVAYLSTHRIRSVDSDDSSCYYEHLSEVAYYLSIGRAKKELKIAALRTIMACLSPAEAQSQNFDTFVEANLDFVTQRSSKNGVCMNHTEITLIWELRAMSLHMLDRKQERVIRLAKTGDTAAVVISMGAKLVEKGVSRSGAALSSQIEYAGLQVKDHIQANDNPILIDRDAVVALTFSNAVRGVSEGAKESTKFALESIRGALARGGHAVSITVDEGMMGDCLSAECREAFKAAGKVGLATIGATAIIGEALFEAGRALMEKTAAVTADIVHHRYGPNAGKVASDAGEAAVNIVRAVGNVAAVSGGPAAFAAIAAKENAKLQAASDVEKAKETLLTIEKHAKTFLMTAIGNDELTFWPKPAANFSGMPEDIATDKVKASLTQNSATTTSTATRVDQRDWIGTIPGLTLSCSLDSESSLP
jgi:Senescence-associated protein